MSEQESTAGSRGRWWLWGAAAVAAVAVGSAIVISGQSTASDGASPSSVTLPTPDTTPPPTPDATTPAPTPDATTPTSMPDASTPASTPADTPGAPAETSPPIPSVTVPIDAEAEVATGVTAHIASLEAVTGIAMQPGEAGGPALRATIELVNNTDASIDLRGAVVNLAYGAASTPASPIAQPGGEPFAQTVAAGETAKGVYVFTVPDAGRDNVSVEVDVRLGGQIPVFEGPAPR
jgi:hypothetical protein